MKNIVNPDVLQMRRDLHGRFSQAKPFRHVVIDDFFTPEFCKRRSRSSADFCKAHDSGWIPTGGILRHFRHQFTGFPPPGLRYP